MLKVVQHEEAAATFQRCGDGDNERSSRQRLQTQSSSHAGGDVVGISQRSQVDEPNTVWKLLQQPGCDMHCETGLSDSTGSGESYHSSSARNQVRQLMALGLAAHEVAQWLRQVVSPPACKMARRLRARGHPGGDLASGGEAKLVADLLDVTFRGSLGDEQPVCDLAVGQAFSDQHRDLALAP
jgi:hypothetical protein